MLAFQNQFDERKQDWPRLEVRLRLLQKRLRRRLIRQSLDAIHAEPPFLVLGQEEDTAMLCLQGDFTLQVGKIQC